MLISLRGPLLLTALCVAPVVLWARSAPLDGRFAGSYSSLTSIAVICALAGTSAFALNLVLGARLRSVEALFGGLDPMYRAHRVNGQIAFGLLLGHGLLILASRTTVSTGTAIDLLGPGAGWTVFAGVLALAAMTVSILTTLFVRVGHEVFVYVQRTFGFIFLAASYHVFTTDRATAQSAALNGYLAVLTTLGLAAFAYRSLLGNVLVRRRSYRVTRVNRLDDAVTEIVMEPRGRPLVFVPGQFVFVNFRSLELHPFELSIEKQVFSFRAGEVGNQFHPFSITAAPGETSLRVTVKAIGDYTRALRRLEPGADAVVEGPYGSFSHWNMPGARQIWLAGGIGVTPFLSMARSLGDRSGQSIDFYYCVEHEEEAHFRSELEAIANSRDDFRITVVPRDREGLLTAERLADAHADLGSAHILVCGPPAMIDSLRSELHAAGVPDERFHAEEFGFAKLGRGGSSPAPPRRRPVPLTALVGALSATALLLVVALAVAAYAT